MTPKCNPGRGKGAMNAQRGGSVAEWQTLSEMHVVGAERYGPSSVLCPKGYPVVMTETVRGYRYARHAGSNPAAAHPGEHSVGR